MSNPSKGFTILGEHPLYLGVDGRRYVVWGDGCLHIFESNADYENPEVEPIAVISPDNSSQQQEGHYE